VHKFAHSRGQSWSHFDEAREEARAFLAYQEVGPQDPEERSVWEANGWWVDRRPSPVLLWQPFVKYHLRPREWFWSMIEHATERLHELAEAHHDREATRDYG
jgi:hypothetical protein